MQFSPTDYILFDAKGGSFRSTISCALERLPSGCWCLCDGNEYVKIPCRFFMRSELRTFLVTSASLETYKKWRNKSDATTVVKEPPRTVEMAAIAWVLIIYLFAAYNPLSRRKMHGFRPCDAVSVSQSWSPNICTIFAILWDPPRMVGSDLNTLADTVSEGTSLTWLQKFLNHL